MVNDAMEHKRGLIADDLTAYLEQSNKSVFLFMKLLDTYGYLQDTK